MKPRVMHSCECAFRFEFASAAADIAVQQLHQRPLQHEAREQDGSAREATIKDSTHRQHACGHEPLLSALERGQVGLERQLILHFNRFCAPVHVCCGLENYKQNLQENARCKQPHAGRNRNAAQGTACGGSGASEGLHGLVGTIVDYSGVNRWSTRACA
jgi:hypothetical protein